MQPRPNARLQPPADAAPGKKVILVVEDDPGDRELTRRAFEDYAGEVDLRFVEDGAEALDYLFRFGSFAAPSEAPRPCLVILDLNIPKVNGRQILQDMRDDFVLRRIPVLVLTESSSDTDVSLAYELGANSYFTKPDSREGYERLIRILDAYWLRRAELPPGAA